MAKQHPFDPSDLNAILVRSAWPTMMKSAEPYVSSECLRQFNIEITPMDIHTGVTHDTGEKYIELMSREHIQEVLSKTRPWESEEWVDFTPDDTDTNLWNARWIWRHFGSILVDSKNNQRCLRDETDLQFRGGRPIDMVSAYNPQKKINWQADIIIEKKDRSKPHRTCVLLDDSPLRDRVLSASELHVICATMASRLAWKGYGQPDIIPVTLISGSQTKMRVVQAWMQQENRRLMVRMTSMLDFPEGPDKNEEGKLAILSWVLGKPVGKTKY